MSKSDLCGRQKAIAETRFKCRVIADDISTALAEDFDRVSEEHRAKVIAMVEGDISSMKAILEVKANYDNTKR